MLSKIFYEPIVFDRNKYDIKKELQFWDELKQEVLRVNKCCVCDGQAEDRYVFKTGGQTEYSAQYVCEKCLQIAIDKDNKEYKIKYDKALKYLKDNDYKIIVHNGNINEREIFGIGEKIMGCIDIIRNRMKIQGYFEDWIDLHWEKYEDCEIEIVDYLSFVIASDTEKDEYGGYKVEKSMEFWIYLSNEDNLHIQ